MKRGGVLEIYVFSWKGIRKIMTCDSEDCAGMERSVAHERGFTGYKHVTRTWEENGVRQEERSRKS